MYYYKAQFYTDIQHIHFEKKYINEIICDEMISVKRTD
jgi:hypothetical protein